MVNRGKRAGEDSPSAAGSASDTRKLTLSCSRCRASKLKCDRKEPCIECIKRDIGHLCTKDERQPRAKRAKKEAPLWQDDQTLAKELEEAAESVERFIDGLGHTQASGSSSAKVSKDRENSYYPAKRNYIHSSNRNDAKVALLADIVEALPPDDMIRALYDCFVTRCQAPLGNVVHTPTFKRQAEKLCNDLSRVPYDEKYEVLDDGFPLDALACLLLALVLGLAFYFAPGCQGDDVQVLARRVTELREAEAPSKWRLLALRCLQGEMTIFCDSIASLQAIAMLLLDGQAKSSDLDILLVSAISGARRLGLHRLGDAELTASTPFTFADAVIAAWTPPHIRTEIGIRIWWALVVRDWTRGQALGYYTIQPSQFNTRLPLHINDEDLCPTISNPNDRITITERPRSEFTMLSYTTQSIEITTLVRESVDLRDLLLQSPRPPAGRVAKIRNDLKNKCDVLSAELPSHFQIGSEVGLAPGDSNGPLAAVPVHRWMLHQQLWTLFLRFHRANLSSFDERATCRLLAKNIIETGEKIRKWCVVCGSLSLGDAQLFNAAAILVIDLLLPPDPNVGDFQKTRREHLERLEVAFSLFKERDTDATRPELHDMPWRRHKPNCQRERVKVSANRCIMTLEALLELEEEQNGIPEISEENKTRGLETGASKSLKDKVFDILEPLNSLIPEGMSMPLPNSTDLQDLDVLPVLSNHPGSRFWQDPESSVCAQTTAPTGFFPASADWETLLDWLPPSTYSSDMHPLDWYDLPELSQMGENTEGCDPILSLNML